MNVKAVVVRITPYKDSGAIINLLSKEALFSFKAHHIYKINHANILLTSPLMYGDFTFSDNKKIGYLIFKEVTPIIDTRLYMNDFNKLTTLNFINEITLRLIEEEDMSLIFSSLVNALTALQTNNNVISLMLLYLATALRLSGNGLEVDNCVITKSKLNIVGVSYLDGGLVCKEAFRPNVHIAYSKNKINILRKIFKANDNDFSTINLPKSEAYEVLLDLLTFTFDQTGVKFKSVSLLSKLANIPL